MKSLVSIIQASEAKYPTDPPYHPNEIYPEFTNKVKLVSLCTKRNVVYEAVRESFKTLGLDSPNLGTSEWNPLGEFIKPGQHVVIKPNLVLHESRKLVGSNCLTTHGSIIRAVVDYAYLALQGLGTITIADAPLQSAKFDIICSSNGLSAIKRYYQNELGFKIELVDLRQIYTTKDDATGYISGHQTLSGDPLGYALFDLKSNSAFERYHAESINPALFAVTDYVSEATRARHAKGRHEYIVSRTILDADVVLIVPKLKVHEKVGITACLKGMIGIIGAKDCLPHFRSGSPNNGGDEFPDQGKFLSLAWSRVRNRIQGKVPMTLWKALRASGKTLSKIILSFQHAIKPGNQNTAVKPLIGGAWYGNDTIWRTVDDLNQIILYGRKDGEILDKPQRRIFSIVDGIIAGEGNGPLDPSPYAMGLIIAGENLWAVDVVSASLIDIDWRCLPMLKFSIWRNMSYQSEDEILSEIKLVSNLQSFSSWKMLFEHAIPLKLPPGWVGFAERRDQKIK